MFLFVGRSFVAESFEWWRNDHKPEELWAQGDSFNPIASIHDPKILSVTRYYDIGFVVNHQKTMKDTNYKDMFKGFQDYVSLFKFVGPENETKHCGANVAADLKGRTCFAVWYCEETAPKLKFKETPDKAEKIVNYLPSPTNLVDGTDFLPCLENAEKLFTAENGVRPKVGDERNRILFRKNIFIFYFNTIKLHTLKNCALKV